MVSYFLLEKEIRGSTKAYIISATKIPINVNIDENINTVNTIG